MKKTKAEVHYSTGTPAEHCGNCVHFLRSRRLCERVAGIIDARYWCDLWEARRDAQRKRAAA